MPRTVPVWVTVAPESVMARAMPKSMTLVVPSELTMMLAGLTSRWTMPWRWAKCSAEHTSAAISSARSVVNGPSLWIRSFSDFPSTNSITR